jgi:RHS repeat-associated protein
MSPLGHRPTRRLRRLLHPLVVLSLLVLAPGTAPTRPAEAQGSGTVSYVYDALGRLAGVLDGAGGIGKYQYDAVGNLTSIKRETSTPVLITGMSPGAAAAGTPITISGVGFSATANQNTVTFKGPSGTPIPATVTAANSTQLSLNVPSGAFTGSLSVSTTSDTAGSSSAAAFTVLDASGRDTRAPIVNAIVPLAGATVGGAGGASYPVAAPGSAVNVFGTNLETSYPQSSPTVAALNVAANNVVSVNGKRAAVSQLTPLPALTPTPTLVAGTGVIHAALPTNVTSGRLSVRVPSGSSTGDTFLFVPPVGRTTGDVLFADVITASASKTITTSAGGSQSVALLAFDGQAGQPMSLVFSNVTYSGCHETSIFAPNGSQVGTTSGCVDPGMDTPPLPVTGTYTVMVQTGGNPGSMTVSLYSAPAATASLTMGGTTMVTITTPGQNAVVTFVGNAGRSVVVQGQNSPRSGHPSDPPGFPTSPCLPKVAIFSRTGTVPLAESTCLDISNVAAVLPATDTYRIVVDPPWANTGSLFLTLVGGATPTPTATPTRTSTPTSGTPPSPTSTPTLSGTATVTFTPTTAPTATPITGPALNVRPTYVVPGGVSSVDWGGLFALTPTTSDWIGLYPAPVATVGDASPVATVFTTGGVSGQVALPIPTSAPTSLTYETRLFNVAGAATRVAVSNSFAVVLTTPTLPPTSGPSPTTTSTPAGASPTSTSTPTRTSTPTSGPAPTPSASLSVRPAIVPQGSTVSATWSGIPTPTTSDWLGLYQPGAADSPAPTATVLTTGQASGQVAFPLSASQAPGSYELRLFNGSGTTSRLAVSNLFVVTAPIGGPALDRPLLGTILGSAESPEPPPGDDALRLLAAWRPLLPPTLSVQEGLAPTTPLAPPPDDDPTWEPETSWTPNLLRLTRTASPWRALPPYQAAHDETALAGQVLGMDGEPLAGVTLRLADAATATDASGRFLLTGLVAGHHVLTIDGGTAAYPGRTYGVFDAAIDLAVGETTVLPYTIWLPRLDTANTVTIPSPTTEEVVLTSPRIPGLEVHLPPGTVIRDRAGNPVTDLSLTTIPQDRPPFPLPKDVYTPVYFTVQPAGATIGPHGARIVYPNYTHALPNTRADFWHYDVKGQGWYVYGRGTVTADGKQIVPDPGTAVYELTAAMTHPITPDPDPPDDAAPPDDDDADAPDGSEGDEENPEPPAPTAGEPVDLSTGLFVVRNRDVIPLRLTRTYRPKDPGVRPFGVGATHPYQMQLYSPNSAGGAWADLILPDGSRVHYTVLAGCTPGPGVACETSTVYQHTATPTRWYGSTIAWDAPSNNGWNLTLRNGTVYAFGNGTGLKSVRDRHGNQVTLTRDGSNRITRITSPNGRWLAFTYGDATYPNSITQVTDNLGRTITYTYCHSTDVCLSNGGTGGALAGRLWKVVDANGGLTQYSYDPTSGGLAKIRDPKGSVATPQYDLVTTTYDANGRVSQQTEVDGSLWTFSYTLSSGKVTQTLVTDPLGVQRQVSFNTSGYVTQDIAAYNQCEKRTSTYSRLADGTNRLASVTNADPNPANPCTDQPGRQTSYGYDGSSERVTSITRLAGTANAVTSYLSYEPTFHQVSSVTDPLGNTARFDYDGQGNLRVATDPLGRSTVLTYNAAGQPLTVTDPLDHTTRYTYELGDLVTVADPLGHQTRRFVDNAGRHASTTSPLGQIGRREFDPLGNVLKQTDPRGQTTLFGYDENSFLKTVTDARGNTTTYTRDETNRVTERKDPLLQTASYTYDLMGNLTQVTDRRNKTTIYCYDNLNRRTFAGFGTISLPGACSPGANYESTIAYTWDKGDRLQQANDSANGLITRTYDDLDRLVSETTPLTSPNAGVTYTYDAADRRRTLTVAGQANSVSYDYDAASRLKGLTQGSTQVTLDYDPAGRRTRLKLPNGAEVSYEYDNSSRLTQITYALTGSSPTLSYGYDAAGQRTSVGGTYARTGLPTALSSATYDPANRITNWNGTTWPGSRWDPNGNLLTDGTDSYSWNARNQLTGISGSQTASFAYDAFGRRKSKTLSGTQTDFLYDGLNAVQERVSGSVTANILTGGLDEVFARTESSTTRALLADALGSTVALVEPGGSIATQYQYEPFGKTSLLSGSSNNPTQFTGRENDGTGLYYYRARYYSPSYQRFISEDPLDFSSGDVNLYAYGANAPTQYTDPLGARVLKQPLPQEGYGPLLGGVPELDPPNPYGSRGSPEHQAMVNQRIQELESRGYQLRGGGPMREEYIRIPEGGHLGARRPDITMIDPEGNIYRENIGRVNANGEPVAREVRALDDLERATGRRPNFTPYQPRSGGGGGGGRGYVGPGRSGFFPP